MIPHPENGQIQSTCKQPRIINSKKKKKIACLAGQHVKSSHELTSLHWQNILIVLKGTWSCLHRYDQVVLSVCFQITLQSQKDSDTVISMLSRMVRKRQLGSETPDTDRLWHTNFLTLHCFSVQGSHAGYPITLHNIQLQYMAPLFHLIQQYRH